MEPEILSPDDIRALTLDEKGLATDAAQLRGVIHKYLTTMHNLLGTALPALGVSIGELMGTANQQAYLAMEKSLHDVVCDGRVPNGGLAAAIAAMLGVSIESLTKDEATEDESANVLRLLGSGPEISNNKPELN